MQNLVTGTINPDSLAKIKDCLSNIRAELPFLIQLSPTESKRLIHLQGGRIDFVTTAMDLANQNEKLKPQFFELDEMERDINLYKQLDTILLDVNKLQRQVYDTRNQAGSEAFNGGLEIYNTAKRGMAKGIEGAPEAYDELSHLFDGQGRFPKTLKDQL
ncbi:MAG: hypothetical protein V4590_03140 [Bacteroidota bacterium]